MSREAPAQVLRKASSKELAAPAPARAAAEAPAPVLREPAAAPARAVAKPKAKVKAKAKVAVKAKPKVKAKAKAKVAAPPGRGAPVLKTVMKAIADKTFAAVAAKAKAASAAGASPPGSGTWYFMSDLRKSKDGAYDEKAWKKYDPKMNKALEMAYTKGFAQYTMKFKDKNYIVKFKTMMQFRADDKYLQRPVKRV
mmetsp:Transcript_3612/g.8505  ORF Transcript_3612/g.8505 Transcript_3612/m.8505 type:complete len:196 (+) Transcript_3612:73-660(+)